MIHLSSLQAGPIPLDAGIGLRFPHHRFVIETRPGTAWFEIHPENYMAGGPALRLLDEIRRDAPLSLHAVGLSLGSDEPLDLAHLHRLRAFADRLEPGLVSDHLSWSRLGGVYYSDLLPLPYTAEALDIVARNIERAQDILGRRLLIENPSRYLAFTHSTIEEPDFLAALAARTGCGLLCDVNNIYVSARNLGFDPIAYLAALPAGAVGEYHLAGHARRRLPAGAEIRIDHHGARVDAEVWRLYEEALARLGPRPTLIEWDTAIPEFAVLEEEAALARARLAAHTGGMHHACAS